MSTPRRPRTYPPGTPERAVAVAVAAVYADAAVRLDQLELDITQPASAPHSREVAVAWRAEQVRAEQSAARAAREEAMRDSFASLGSFMARTLSAIEDTAQAINRAFPGLAAMQDSYALAGPADGEG